jgi:hypothetical protein
MNVTLFGNRIFGAVIQLRCVTGLKQALNPVTGVLIRKERCGDTSTQKKRTMKSIRNWSYTGISQGMPGATEAGRGPVGLSHEQAWAC